MCPEVIRQGEVTLSFLRGQMPGEVRGGSVTPSDPLLQIPAQTTCPPPSPGPAVPLAGLLLKTSGTLAGVRVSPDRASPPAAPGGRIAPSPAPPEIIWPHQNFQGLESVVKHPGLVGVLGALVRLLSLLNGAHRLSQCLAGVNALPLQVLVSQLGLESLQVDLPEGTGSLVGHLLGRQGLHALLERRQDSHLIVQHLLRDQLLVPPPGRGLLRGRFPALSQGLMQLLLLPDRLVHLGVVELEALSLRLLQGPLHFDLDLLALPDLQRLVVRRRTGSPAGCPPAC